MASLAIRHTNISEMEVSAEDPSPMYSPPDSEVGDGGTPETDSDSDSRVIAPIFMLATNVDKREERQGKGADKSGAHSVPLTPPKSPSSGERELPGHNPCNASLKSLNQLHNNCELPLAAVVTHGAGVGFSDDGGGEEGSCPAMPAMPAPAKVTKFQKKPHHLLKHVISLEKRGMNAVKELGASSIREAVEIIGHMAQKDLQKNFCTIYDARSLSNNNNWLRRKLLEAICPKDDTSADAIFVKEAMRSMTFTRSSRTAEERNNQAQLSLKEPRRPRAAAAGVSLATAALLKEPALESRGAPHSSKRWVHLGGHHERKLDDGRSQMKRRQGIKRSRMDLDFEEEEGEEGYANNFTTAGSDSQRELAQSLRQLATVLSTALQTTGLPGLQTVQQPAPPPPPPPPLHPHFLPPSFAGPVPPGRTNFPPPYPHHPPQHPFPPHHYRPFPGEQCRPGGNLMRGNLMPPPRSFPIPASPIPMSATKPQP